ncbi:MAG TPA: fatty acid desaturase, partial [Chroococcidiopsis sp.]
IILSLWVTSLVGLLSIDLSTAPLTVLLAIACGRTFLQTGLFVIAHDAMHGNLAPHSKRLNDRLGAIAVGLYACLPYRQSCINHTQHHRKPGQPGDPDFHDGTHDHPALWYINFLKSYISLRCFVTLLFSGSLVFGIFEHLAATSVMQFLWVWALPLILSSMQLFFFGTYLPHRNERDYGRGLCQIYRPHSGEYWQYLWSLLSCYHFGCYHREHHYSPKTPWYRLPSVVVLP